MHETSNAPSALWLVDTTIRLPCCRPSNLLCSPCQAGHCLDYRRHALSHPRPGWHCTVIATPWRHPPLGVAILALAWASGAMTLLSPSPLALDRPSLPCSFKPLCLNLIGIVPTSKHHVVLDSQSPATTKPLLLGGTTRVTTRKAGCPSSASDTHVDYPWNNWGHAYVGRGQPPRSNIPIRPWLQCMPSQTHIAKAGSRSINCCWPLLMLATCIRREFPPRTGAGVQDPRAAPAGVVGVKINQQTGGQCRPPPVGTLTMPPRLPATHALWDGWASGTQATPPPPICHLLLGYPMAFLPPHSREKTLRIPCTRDQVA
jgi:hypothetical protein